MTMRQLAVRAGAIAAGAALIAACGTQSADNTNPPPSTGGLQNESALAAALTRVSQQASGSSAKMSAVETIAIPDNSTPAQITVQGEIKFDAPTAAQLTETNSLLSGISKQSGVNLPSSIPIVLTSNALYVDLGSAMDAQLGASWIKYTASDLQSSNSPMAASLAGMMNGQFSPSQQVDMLIAGGHIQQQGSELVDGVLATHYGGDVSIKDLIADTSMFAKLPASEKATLQQDATALGMTTDHIDVWVDGGDHILRETEHASTSNGPLTVDRHFSDWGVQVSVTPPAASDTIDASQIPGSGMG